MEMVRELLDELNTTLAGLGELDPAGLGDDELAGALVAAMRAGSALDAAVAHLAGEADARRIWAGDGSKSCSGWLGRAAGRPVGEARSVVRRARRLRHMPVTDRAHGAGEIAVAHVQRLIGAARVDRDAFAVDEEMLVDQARSLRFDDFCRAIAYWCQLHDPDGTEDQARDRYEARRLHLSETLDGTGALDAWFDPIGLAEFRTALERIENELWKHDWAEARDRLGEAATDTDLARSGAQRRYDALIEMARRATSAPKGAKQPRPLITVLVDYPTLAGRVCELSTGPVVTPGEILPLLNGADVERVVFDGPSRVLDVGERQRLFTGATRRAVQVRDRRCDTDTCTTPAHRCDVDHIEPYEPDGLTIQTNGRLRCPAHHSGRRRRRPPNPDDQDDDW
ncbi:MAG: DUF222 domain-containing protein [Acidimicrobiales bacterium]|nr:DUF222 domain-containing protein [Acidimicrobiales bacterium]